MIYHNEIPGLTAFIIHPDVSDRSPWFQPGYILGCTPSNHLMVIKNYSLGNDSICSQQIFTLIYEKTVPGKGRLYN